MRFGVRWIRRRLRALSGDASFGANVAKLLGGTLSAQLVVIVSAPLLTRLFSPSEFGLYAAFVAFLSVLLEVATLRYELAIPLPRSSAGGFHVVVASGLTALGVLSVLAVMLFLFSEQLESYLQVESSAPFCILLVATLLIMSANKIAQYWIMRSQGFGVLSTMRVAQSAGMVGAQIITGAVGVTQYGLILGHTVGQGVGNARALFSAYPAMRNASRTLSWRRLRSAMIKYRRFPIYSTWSAAANALSAQAPILLLTLLFSPAVAGLYALSKRVLQTPLTMIGGAVSQVFYANAATLSPKDLRESTLQVFTILARVAFPIMIMLGVASPTVFGIVFGAEWSAAGQISQNLVPWLLLVFISAPLSTLPSILGNQRREMYFQLTLLLARSASLVVGGVLQDFLLATLLFAVVSAAFWFGFLLWNLSTVGISWITVLRILFAQAFHALLLLIPFWVAVAVDLVAGNAPILFVGIAVSCILVALTTIKHLSRGRKE